MLRIIGLGLFLVGTALATSFAAKTVPSAGGNPLVRWFSESGIPFCLSLAALALGALLLRIEPAGGAGRVLVEESTPRGAIRRLAATFAALPPVSGSDARELRLTLDDLLERRIPEVLEHKDAMIASMGLAAYARAMTPFASFERNVARAWSALIDDCPQETERALERAEVALRGTIEQLDSAPGSQAGNEVNQS